MKDPGQLAPDPGGRPQRADARRNLDALLAAAKTVFADSGVDAPAKQITDLAGVGVGTLYRHFPRRSDLVVAVLQHEIDELATAATELAGQLDPWGALSAWIDRLAALVSTKRGFASALHSGDPAFDDLPGYFMGRLEPAAESLLGAAHGAGTGRDDVSPGDLLLTVSMMCRPVPGQGADFNERMIRVFVDGLRSEADQAGGS